MGRLISLSGDLPLSPPVRPGGLFMLLCPRQAAGHQFEICSRHCRPSWQTPLCWSRRASRTEAGVSKFACDVETSLACARSGEEAQWVNRSSWRVHLYSESSQPAVGLRSRLIEREG